MLAGVSDAVLAKCPLFRGMTAPERHELIAMLENNRTPRRDDPG